MALSNIFREPRREITESVIGLLVTAPIFGWIYFLSGWLRDHDSTPIMPLSFYIAGALLFTLGGAAMSAGILLITHAIGDGVCNALQRGDIHLRPRNRPTAR